VLRSAVDQDPQCFDALFQLGFACDVAHEHVEFLNTMCKTVEVNPTHAQSWLFRGLAESRLADHDAALKSFARAVLLDQHGTVGKDASLQLGILQRNMRCPLMSRSCWDVAAPLICSQQPRQAASLKTFFPPRPLFRSQSVHVWDGALSPPLLARLFESVDDLSTYLLRNPQNQTTCWLPREATPRTAAEVAGRALLHHVLGLRTEDFLGIEWWCKNQAAGLGAHFHYDNACADKGLHRPTFSSVLYLADEGGPTVVLDQAADLQNPQWPQVPQEGFVVMPRVNRWMVFPGELRHGALSVDDDVKSRWVVLYNFWTSHRPGLPNCQIPDFRSYKPVSAYAPTARHLLPPIEIVQLAHGEEHRERSCVQLDTLDVGDTTCSSDCGELPCAMPMPSLSCMRPARALYIPWRRLAADITGTRDPFPSLQSRLLSWEREPRSSNRSGSRPVELATSELCKRKEVICSWLSSRFLTTARGLIRDALAKSVACGQDECKMSLASLSKYIADNEGGPSTCELDGAYLTQNCILLKASTCDHRTLQGAIFDAIKHEFPSGFHADCQRVYDEKLQLIMRCTNLRSCEAQHCTSDGAMLPAP